MRVAINGTELYVDVEGAGLVPDGPRMRERPVVLVLHGGPGYDHAHLKPLLGPLAATAQLVYVDHRGQGRSGRPPVATCTLEQYADDAAAVCRTLGLGRPAVLGQSFGGFVALHLALRHPEVVGRLVLVDTGATTADLAEALALLEQRHGPAARAAAARVLDGDPDPAARAAFRRLVMPAYAHPAAQALWAATMGLSTFTPEVSVHFWGRLRREYDVRPRLGEIRAPTLVVVGEHDWLMPPSRARELAAGIPGAELLVLPDAYHFALGEQPALFHAAVRRFLTTTPAD